MKTNLSHVVAIALFLASCASATPNAFPLWSINFVGPGTNENLAKISDAARQAGFERKQISDPTIAANARLLEFWVWPERRSTELGIYQKLFSKEYLVIFSETQTPGTELKGLSCRKYMEFVAALKARFPSGAFQPYRETCAP